MVDGPSSSLEALERAVASDPVLGAHVLKVANSPFYGRGRQIGSLRQALFVLGFQAARDMTLALALLALGGRSTAAAGGPLDPRPGMGVIAQGLAAAAAPDLCAEALVAGLLHDMGN